MKRPLFLSPISTYHAISLFSLVVFFLFFSLGCSVFNRGSDEAPPPDAESESVQQGVLTCSDECAARGQCGQRASDNQTVILGNPDRPAVSDHQMAFPADASLAILSVQEETLQDLGTGEQFRHPFYLVRREDEKAGWVAGWCIIPQ